jgi:hypothetical protein
VVLQLPPTLSLEDAHLKFLKAYFPLDFPISWVSKLINVFLDVVLLPDFFELHLS